MVLTRIVRYRRVVLEFHRLMLRDRVRNDAFWRALKQVIVPGHSTVIDIGAGTGFLGFLARSLGAKHVTLIERDSVIELAKKIAKESGITNCSFVPHSSVDIKNPVRASIVVSEVLGNYPTEEHVIETMNDVHRFLHPGGITIPQGIRSYVAPVVSDAVYATVSTWKEIGYGLSYESAAHSALQNPYVRTIHPSDLYRGISSAQCFDTLFFTRKNSGLRRGKVSWTIDRNVQIFGLCVWWESDLVPGVTLSTSPAEPPTHWEQIFLPLFCPMDVSEGEQLIGEVTSDSRPQTGFNVAWRVMRMAGDRLLEEQRMDMRQGMLY